MRLCGCSEVLHGASRYIMGSAGDLYPSEGQVKYLGQGWLS